MKKFGSIFLVLILLICCLTSCDFFESLQSEATTKAAETTQSPEHIHQWQDVSGEHARICVECNEKQLASEACDWQYVGQISDCWSTTITYGCSKCYQQQLVHGDSVLPNHNWIEETANGKTALHCSRCKESCTFVSGLQEFSYVQVLEEYKIGDPGVKHENFYNPEVEREVTSAIDAIMRAQFELTVEYDTISVSQDKDANMWCVDFWTLDVDGGGQSVYLNGNGLTCYIVYGE
ncbi:MAG: hypothetical protein J6V22_05645 [Clostridia bacterium]|nr:hypothetical protein [Clostridia bacterium]